MKQTDSYRLDTDLEAVFQGRITPGFQRVVDVLAERLAGRWWTGNRLSALNLAERIRAHAVRNDQRCEINPCRGRLLEAISQSEESGFTDAVLDPLLEMLAEVRPATGWTRHEHEVFLRCFLLEIALVEAWRMEVEILQTDGRAAGELWMFLTNKARPVLSRYFGGRSGDMEDALSELAQGLLCMDKKNWRRKTMMDFDRSKASLSAFVIQAARFHALDVLQKKSRDVSLSEDQDIGVVQAVLPEEDGTLDAVTMDEWVQFVLRHNQDAPACLNPATNVGRKRLALLEGYFLSHLADERQGAHTCEEGTTQLKFIFTQGLTPAMVLGAMGGERPHARDDGNAMEGASDDDNLLTRGFREEGCKQYQVENREREENWLHWRVLYTTAFFAAITRAGLLDLRAEIQECAPGRFDVESLRSWCIRRTSKEQKPARMDYEKVLAAYQKWIGVYPQAEIFSIRVEKDSVSIGHAYPHVLLSSYAGNAFCALYVGVKLGKAWSVDELRIALKDLRKVLRRVD